MCTVGTQDLAGDRGMGSCVSTAETGHTPIPSHPRTAASLSVASSLCPHLPLHLCPPTQQIRNHKPSQILPLSSHPSSTEVCAWELCKQNSPSAVTHRERLPVLSGVPPEDNGGDTRDAHRARVSWGAHPPHGSRVPLGRQGQLLKTNQHRLDTGSDSNEHLSKVWV